MRTLVIQRRSAFSSFLLKMYVYIEDRENPTTKIAGTPCRLLGYLKNGDTASFSIPETACRIYVAARKPFGWFSSETITLPEGSETIALIGKSCFDPITDRQFCFDDITAEDTLRHRIRNLKKALWLVLGKIALGTIIGVLLAALILQTIPIPLANPPQEYEKNGVSITLPSDFQEMDDKQNWLAVYANNTCTIAILRESQHTTGINNLPDYAKAVQDLVHEEHHPVKQRITTQDELTYMEHTEVDEGVRYYWFTFFYKTPSGAKTTYFYRVYFIVLDEDKENMRDSIFEWAKTVEVG